MKRYEMIKSKKDFTFIINNQKFRKSDFFVIYKQKANINYPQFGIAISKSFGKAVDRNKIKRQTRNIIDNNKYLFKNGYKYIIMIRKAANDVSYQELSENLVSLVIKEIKWNLKNQKAK